MSLSQLLKKRMPRTQIFEDWELFYQSNKLKHIRTIKNPMTSGIMQMMETEGFVNFIKIMFKMITNSGIRNRMMDVQNTFGKYNDYIGYGIYIYRK